MARLERQNRMLKRTGTFLFLVCFSAIGVIGWQVKRVSGIFPGNNTGMISASQFNLVDDKGNLQGMLAWGTDGPTFDLRGPGKGGLSFIPITGVAANPGGFSLTLSSASGKQQISLDVGDSVSSETIGTGNSLDTDNIHIMAGEYGQRIMVSDELGFRAILGKTFALTSPTGGSMTTSGAALTLFNKNGHVIWMVPKP